MMEKKAGRELTPMEVLQMALQREKAAFKFYKEQAAAAKPPIRDLLKELADEEERHVAQLEDALDSFFHPDN